MGLGQAHSSHDRTSRTQGRVYAVLPEAEHADQQDMKGTFYTYICFLMHLIY